MKPYSLTFSDLAILEKQMQDVVIVSCPLCCQSRAVVLNEDTNVFCPDCRVLVAQIPAQIELRKIDWFQVGLVVFFMAIFGVTAWEIFGA